MKKFLLFITIIIVFFTTNVYAITDYKFKESNDLNVPGGMLYGCYYDDDNTALCSYFDTSFSNVKIYKININNETSEVVKEISGNYIISDIEKVDDGYIAVGLLMRWGMRVIHFDNDFNILSTSSIYGSNSVAQIYKKPDGYYILTKDINEQGYLAAKLSNDFNSISYVSSSDVSYEGHEELYVYQATYNSGIELEGIGEVIRFSNGYLVSYTINTDDISGEGISVSGGILYVENGEVKWNKGVSGEAFGGIITRNNSFYVVYEETTSYKTYLIEYDKYGNQINKEPIDILNESQRFIMQNYVLGVHDNKFMFVTYKPASDFGINCTAWKILSIDMTSAIIQSNTTNGTYTVDNDKAFPGDVVTINTNPDEGYKLDHINVYDFDGNIINVDNNSFVMPASEVSIDVVYTKNNLKGAVKGVTENPKTGVFSIGLYILITISICTFIYHKVIKHKLFKSI